MISLAPQTAEVRGRVCRGSPHLTARLLHLVLVRRAASLHRGFPAARRTSEPAAFWGSPRVTSLRVTARVWEPWKKGKKVFHQKTARNKNQKVITHLGMNKKQPTESAGQFYIFATRGFCHVRLNTQLGESALCDVTMGSLRPPVFCLLPNLREVKQSIILRLQTQG